MSLPQLTLRTLQLFSQTIFPFGKPYSLCVAGLFLFVCLFVAEKSGKEVMSKGSTGMEVILASLKVGYVKRLTMQAITYFNLVEKKN